MRSQSSEYCHRGVETGPAGSAAAGPIICYVTRWSAAAGPIFCTAAAGGATFILYRAY